MRSLHVITSATRRGAEVFARELVMSLATMGHDPRLVALTAAETPNALAVGVLGPSRRSPRTLAELRRNAREVDVVVAHGSSTLEACATALAGTATPFVYRSIGDPVFWVAPGLRRLGLRLLHRRPARHVALWDGAAQLLSAHYGLPRERIDVIPNATPEGHWPVADENRRRAARRYLGVPLDVTCLAFVGALSPEKDLGAVLHVTAGLPDALVLVAGDGPERPHLESAAERLPNLRLLGAVDDPGEVYAAADLLLLPSRTEGAPGVVIEAGLSGTASVASAVGALPEMLIDDDTGFLVPPGDPRALLDRVHQALPRAHRVGQRAAQAFRLRHTMERVAPQWAQSMARARDAGDGRQ